MKDQIMALLGEWKEKQSPELGKGAKKKEYLIQECLAGRMREAVRQAGAGHSTMHTWISRYRTEGAAALCENGNAQRWRYSEEIRRKAVEEYLSGQGSSLST